MIEARTLACLRGERELFRDLSFSLAPGEWLHLRGVNGAGKTSLLRILCGLLRPENGAVFWQNENIALQPELYHANLCYIGHASGLKDELSALENLRLLHAATAARPLNDMPLVDSLRQIGLENYLHRPVRTLSQGQKRRVALAKLGISQAPLWILDEPLASLDGEAIQVIRDLLVNHLRAKGMLVMTSHQTIDLTIPGRELWIGNRPEDNSLDHAHASNDTMASCV